MLRPDTMIPFLVLAGLAACAATPPAGPGTGPTAITVSEQPCFGVCPVYSMTVTPDDRYVLDGERFTRTEGRSEGQLPTGSFGRMVTALQAADFTAIPGEITHGSEACGQPVASDLPTTIIATDGPVAHDVVWYQGCFGTPWRDGLATLRDTLHQAYRYDQLVAPPQDKRR